jgi:hypothetical protein
MLEEKKPNGAIAFIAIVFLFTCMIIAVIGLGTQFYKSAKKCEANLMYCESNLKEIYYNIDNDQLENFVKECKENNGTFEYYFNPNSTTVLKGLGCMFK